MVDGAAGAGFFNWGEYSVHIHLGYHKHKLSAMFYKRHTGDHHSSFVEDRMCYECAQDWLYGTLYWETPWEQG